MSSSFTGNALASKYLSDASASHIGYRDQRYKAAYTKEPSYHAAGGYAAALTLQKAIEDAGSLETEAVKAALDGMDVLTFFGHMKFNTTAEAHGLQVGHEMVYIQWQKDGSNLVKKIVWPAEGANADAVYPLER